MPAPKYYYNLNRCISDGKTQFDTTNMPKGTYEVNGQIYSGSNDLMDLLNEQHETIQRLKQNVDELLSVDIEEELLKENEQLKTIIDQLRTDNTKQKKKLNTTMKENEQLKKRLELYAEIYPTGRWITELKSEELQKELKK